jgi:hypothetical protein
MWWPALGGIVVGAGGLFYPQALGVGYNNVIIIAELLRGHMVLDAMLGIFLVKSMIWAIALGSGTSGGVLAPLLMIGGELGGLASGFSSLPGRGLLEARGDGFGARWKHARAPDCRRLLARAHARRQYPAARMVSPRCCCPARS